MFILNKMTLIMTLESFLLAVTDLVPAPLRLVKQETNCVVLISRHLRVGRDEVINCNCVLTSRHLRVGCDRGACQAEYVPGPPQPVRGGPRVLRRPVRLGTSPVNGCHGQRSAENTAAHTRRQAVCWER